MINQCTLLVLLISIILYPIDALLVDDVVPVGSATGSSSLLGKGGGAALRGLLRGREGRGHQEAEQPRISPGKLRIRIGNSIY